MSDQEPCGFNIQCPPTKDEIEWQRQSDEKVRQREEALSSVHGEPEGDPPAMSHPRGKEYAYLVETIQIGRTTLRLYPGHSIEVDIDGKPAALFSHDWELEISHVLVCWFMGLQHRAKSKASDGWEDEFKAAEKFRDLARARGISLEGIARQIAQVQRSQASVARQLKEGK